MPTPETITKTKYRGALRRSLMHEVGWSASSGIKDTSYLYAVDRARTAPNASTAHFGLVKNHGATLRRVFVAAGTALTSEIVMAEPRQLRRIDYQTRTYGPLVNRLHFRINQVLESHVWRLVRLAYSDMGVNTEHFRLAQKVRRFAGNAERNLFRRYLTQYLIESFPKLANTDPVVSDTALNAMFKNGNTFDLMNREILAKVVKGRAL